MARSCGKSAPHRLFAMGNGFDIIQVDSDGARMTVK